MTATADKTADKAEDNRKQWNVAMNEAERAMVRVLQEVDNHQSQADAVRGAVFEVYEQRVKAGLVNAAHRRSVNSPEPRKKLAKKKPLRKKRRPQTA